MGAPKICLTMLLSFAFCIYGTCSEQPPAYEIIKVPIVPPDHYEQMAASYEQMAAAYAQLACQYHNSWGTVSLGADYLCWHADNDTLDYAIDGVGTNLKGQAYSLDAGWQSGFRAFAGYFFPCDDWLLNFSWTHFAPSETQSTRPSTGLTLYPNRGTPVTNFTPLLDARASWSLCLDTLKSGLSYVFWTRHSLSLTPYIGIRWDRISDKFDVTYTKAAAPTTQFVYIHQDVNAVGPSFGIGSEWNFYRNLSLFGDFQWAALWSRYRVSYRLDVVQAALTSDINTGEKKYFSKHTLDFLVGVKWECRINSRSGVIVKLGWENLIWFDYGESFYFVDTVTDGVTVRATGDLTISGLTVRANVFF